jgi:hypothetical protein
MATPSWNSVRARQEMGRLTAPGVLGFYTHFEATELFAVPAGQTAPTNVLTVLVAEERLPEAAAEPVLLNSQRIKPRHLKGWSFGIKRYVKPIVELIPAFDQLSDSKKWRLSGELLGTGDLVPVPTQFVPPDATGTAPLNRVLKNNFWNGSHLFEWADPIKAPFSAVFRNPPALQELSDAIRRFVPIGIAGLSDRLGNIIVQLPVTVLIAKFGQRRTSGDFTVAIGWHPKAAPRPLRATCQKEYDNTISDFMSANTDASETLLPLQSGQGLHRGLVYDDQNQLLLAASGDLGFISSVALRILPVVVAPPATLLGAIGTLSRWAKGGACGNRASAYSLTIHGGTVTWRSGLGNTDIEDIVSSGENEFRTRTTSSPSVRVGQLWTYTRTSANQMFVTQAGRTSFNLVRCQ